MTRIDARDDQGTFTLTLLTAALYILLSVVLNFTSRGFLEADGVTHYLYARFAFQCPAYFADVWARPMRMLVHAVPAYLFGLHGVRAASLVCVLITAWLVWRIADKLGWKWPAYAAFFLLIQPLLFLHSFSELTEVPFALLGALAFHQLLARRWWLFTLICGAMPASRPEGAGFVLLAIALLLVHRQWKWLPLVAVPILVWNTYGWYMFGADSGPWHRWLIDRFPYSAESLYAAGPIWRFLAVLPFVVSPIALPAILIGSAELSRRLRGFALRDLEQQVHLLIVAIPWGILIVHSYLHWAGKMSSSGEPRYLLAAAPFWALLAARGWVGIVERLRLPRPALIVGLGACVPIVADLTYPVVPIKLQPDAELCEKIANWYAKSDLARSHPLVYATHPLVYLYTDRQVQDVKGQLIANPPHGAFFVFDSLYASYNSDPSRKISQPMFDAAGWTKIDTGFGLPDQVWQIYVSPQPADAASHQ